MNFINTLLFLSLSLVLSQAFIQKADAQEMNTVIVSDSRGSSIGFRDSSFNYRSEDELDSVKFCFLGHSNQICSHISQMVFKMNAQYSGGAHDRIELKSCEVVVGDYHRDQEYVETSYVLSDDYGSEFNVNRKIYPCGRN